VRRGSGCFVPWLPQEIDDADPYQTMDQQRTYNQKLRRK
jgi:hypothetical protein